jgi:dihydroneopterin aldolase
MPSQNKLAQLNIKDFKLSVKLGWPKEERLQKQTISLDIDIVFQQPPKACQTDKLDDTVCYHDLVKRIEAVTRERSFFLIEHLSAFIYEQIKPLFPLSANIVVHITKTPKIDNLAGGMRFSYGDQ